jgi:hypothetical protein
MHLVYVSVYLCVVLSSELVYKRTDNYFMREINNIEINMTYLRLKIHLVYVSHIRKSILWPLILFFLNL